ncbi:MAG: DRTGG domain-containing protein [Candidatus Eisenbacteria bacterium]|nr:DRTGG domain-containing protein [Candidatus Eisenbacteria bacterium]
MKLKDIAKALDLKIKAGENLLDREVTGGYASDLLSDVLANAKKGNIWVTLQTHLNIVAVASATDLCGIIIVNNRIPEEETLKKAEEERIPILVSSSATFKVAARLYELGLR